MSRKGRVTSGRRWTLTRMQDDWRCEVLDPVACAAVLDQHWGDLDLSVHGTVVLWDELDALSTNNSDRLRRSRRHLRVLRTPRKGRAQRGAQCVFHQRLAGCDYVETTEWSRGTDRSTRERRLLMYSLLVLTNEQAHFCDEHYPYAPALDAPVNLVTRRRGDGNPGIQANARHRVSSIGTRISTICVTSKRGMQRTSQFCRKLPSRSSSDCRTPESPAPYQSTSLVVGYVQSGKTANFTGLIARAADAGYRLIIVFAGTINFLREQTQRSRGQGTSGTRALYRRAL